MDEKRQSLLWSAPWFAVLSLTKSALKAGPFSRGRITFCLRVSCNTRYLATTFCWSKSFLGGQFNKRGCCPRKSSFGTFIVLRLKMKGDIRSSWLTLIWGHFASKDPCKAFFFVFGLMHLMKDCESEKLNGRNRELDPFEIQVLGNK